MQGDPRIIDLLNQVLRKELTGINQYFIHSRMCKNWGYAVLEKVHYDEAIEEMKHADLVIQRILFLEGIPNLADYDRILVGATPKDAARQRPRPGARRPRRSSVPASRCRWRSATTGRETFSSASSSTRSTTSTGSRPSGTRSPRSGTSSTCPSRSTPDGIRTVASAASYPPFS